MSNKTLDDDRIEQMYNDPNITVKQIQQEFGISSGTVYRHLGYKKVKSNRKTSVQWTADEDAQLIAARVEGLTGAELYERIPTREPAGIKSHTQKLRALKLLR